MLKTMSGSLVLEFDKVAEDIPESERLHLCYVGEPKTFCGEELLPEVYDDPALSLTDVNCPQCIKVLFRLVDSVGSKA